MPEVYIDGSPKLGQICIVKEDEVIVESPPYECLTNNEYEYAALRRALDLVQDSTIYTDSLLVANQINGRYKVKVMYGSFKHCLAHLGNNKVKWIHRRLNKAGVHLDKLMRDMK